MDSILTRRRPVLATLLAASVCGALLASGCESTRLRPETRVTTSREPEGTTHRLDPARSELHVLVYRAGAFARLGHNHVIAARELDGRLSLTREVLASTFELLLPVAALDVDPARWRAHYGGDFASTPTADDIDGTRANMLGAALLDGVAYPYVRVAGRILGTAETNSADIEIAIKDTVVRRTTPVALAVTADTVVASGQLSIDHAELGLTPFSVMLGALRVAEPIEIRFEIVATRVAVGQ